MVLGSAYSGITATTVSARDVTSSRNGVAGLPGRGFGIIGWAGVRGREVTVTDNADEGIFVAWGPLALHDAVVTGNGGSGV